MRHLSRIIAMLVFAGSMLLSGLANATETILFNCFFPTQHPICKVGVKELADRIKTATDGRVILRIPPKSLAAPPDQYEAVSNGVMDGALIFNAFLAKKVPGIQFSLLPFVGKLEAEATSVALWNTYQKHFSKTDEYGDVVLLAVHASNGGEFFSTTDQPIRTIADIAGRKMWALPGTTANTIKATGSAVVSGPAVQMLEIISKGVVDGYTGVPFASVGAFKLGDYTKSATIFKDKIFQPTFSWFISRKKWEAISPEDQKAIRNVTGAGLSGFIGAINDGLNERQYAAMKNAGVPLLDGDPAVQAELEAFGQPIIDAWLSKMAEAGIDGKTVLADYAAAFDEASK